MTADLRSELLKVRQEHGVLNAKNVVDTARPEDHPLHSRFEWNDSAAGERWRLHQAGELIRSVRITYKEPDENNPGRSVRAFHAVPNANGFAFDPVEEVAADPFRRQLMLATMEREWRALHRRYQEFSEFIDLVRSDLGIGTSRAA